MKSIIHIIIISAIFSNVLFAQSYFNLGDQTGFNAELNEELIIEAADNLVETLPVEFQDSFKVLTMAYYLPIEYYKDGRDVYLQKLIEDVQSEYPYYLLIAIESDHSKLYSKFSIDIKLPDITEDGCLPSLKLKAKSLIELSINDSYKDYNNDPLQFAIAIEHGINSLSNFIAKATMCCDQNENIDECLLCGNSEYIVAELTSMKFIDTIISNIRNSNSATNEDILDLSEKKFQIENRTTVNFSEDLEIIIDSLEASQLTVKVFITDDEVVCTPVWDSLKTIANSNTYDIVLWYHIHEPSQSGDPDRLFCSITTKGQGRVYVINIIKALGASVSDAFLQALVIYLMEDEVDSYWAAFLKVNYLESALAGLCGLVAINEKLVEAMGAAASATGTVVSNSFLDQEYTFEEGLADFSSHFIISYIGIKAGAALGNACKKIGAEYFTSGSLTKLSKIFGESVLGKVNFIKLAWKLEDSALTNHQHRGKVFEDLLHKWFFSLNGFYQTSVNFKAIDFWKQSDRLGISLKTTIRKDKSGLKSWLRENILDLQDAKIEGYIEYQSKAYTIDDVKLIVIVPEENELIVNSLLEEIMTELDPDNLVIWEVKKMEDYIE